MQDAQRRAAYSHDVSALQRRLDELEFQDRFYTDVQALLSADQLALVSPGEFRGRAGGSLFGPDSPSWRERR